MIKSWLQNQGLVMSGITVIVSLAMTAANPVTDIMCRSAGAESNICKNSKDLAKLILDIGAIITAGTGTVAIKSVLDEGHTYTPHWLPGPNKEYLYEQFIGDVADVFVDTLPPSEYDDDETF